LAWVVVGDFYFLNIPGETDLFSELVWTKPKAHFSTILIVFGHKDFFDFTSKFWKTF